MEYTIRKRYVGVYAHFDETGTLIPLMIEWYDGRKFEVDKVLDVRPGASRKAGGQGIRYLCRIKGIETAVYFEDPQWFVEERIKKVNYH